MSGETLLGPFLTRVAAARRGGMERHELTQREDFLRLGGRWLQEVYFGFQFDQGGMREDLGRVVQSLKGQVRDVSLADWLTRPNAAFGTTSPLGWFDAGRDRGPAVVATFNRQSFELGTPAEAPGMKRVDSDESDSGRTRSAPQLPMVKGPYS